MFIKGGEKMKTKIIILCSALINIGLIAALNFSLGIYKHKKDNPYALEYYTQFIFNEDGNYKIIE